MILQRLKHETQAQHAQIERAVDLAARLRSRDGYRAVLTRFYGYYAPLEAGLARVDGLALALGDLAARWKTARLAADLSALGLPAHELPSLPSCAELPALPTVAHAFGCLYVLEGATLGGQLITRQVTADLGVTPASGAAFFAGYGAATGPMWRGFGAALTAHATTPDHEARMVATARATFSGLEQWLAAMR